MSGIRGPVMVNGVPVVAAPAGIDITTAEQLRTVLLDSAGHGNAITVVDMTRTLFFDSAGLSVLIRAHRHALAEGGELRVLIPADSPAFRVFTLIGLHRLIPWFSSLDQALPALSQRPARDPAAVSVSPAGLHPARQPASQDQEV